MHSAPACSSDVSSQSIIVGFINGTLLSSSKLTHDALFQHDPHGSILAIHSVVTDPALRQRGVGGALLRQYLSRLDNEFPAVHETVLMAKEGKLRFYQAAGFDVIGPSDVVHGQDVWFECRRRRPSASSATATAETESLNNAASKTPAQSS